MDREQVGAVDFASDGRVQIVLRDFSYEHGIDGIVRK